MEPVTIPTFVDVELARQSFKENLFEQEVHGIRTWKLTDDLSRYAHLIKQSQPQVVVELGTAWGGSALWFANLGLQVITVDINLKRSLPARKFDRKKQITWIVGTSTGNAAYRRISHMVRKKRTMVVHDSDHHLHNVVKEIQLYSPLVSHGCYFVVEDGIFDLMGADGKIGGTNIPKIGGSLRAIQQTLAKDHRWIRDTDVEQLTALTHNPAGYWRRA